MRRLSLFLLVAAGCSSPASAQPTRTAPEPLYDLDTAPQPAPAAGSRLDHMLKSLHVRVCARADVPPFGYFQTAGLGGFDIALASEIVDQLSIDYKAALTPQWVIVTADDRVKRLQDDGCDLMIGAFSYTKERAAEVATTKVYAQTDKVLIAAASITHKPAVIGKLEGTTGDTGITGTTRTFKSYQEIIHAMDSGEIDYLAADRPIAEHLLRSTIKSFTIGRTLAAKSESYVAAVKKGDPQLLAAVDRALETIAKTGHLALLERRWL